MYSDSKVSPYPTTTQQQYWQPQAQQYNTGQQQGYNTSPNFSNTNQFQPPYQQQTVYGYPSQQSPYTTNQVQQEPVYQGFNSSTMNSQPQYMQQPQYLNTGIQEIERLMLQNFFYIERVDKRQVGFYCEGGAGSVPLFVFTLDKQGSAKVYHMEKVTGGRGSLLQTQRLPFYFVRKSHALTNSDYTAYFNGQEIAFFKKDDWDDKIRAYSDSSKRLVLGKKKKDFIVDSQGIRLAWVKVKSSIGQIQFNIQGVIQTTIQDRLVLTVLLHLLHKKKSDEETEGQVAAEVIGGLMG